MNKKMESKFVLSPLDVKRIILGISRNSLSNLDNLSMVLKSLGTEKLRKFNKYFNRMEGHNFEFDCLYDDFEKCLDELSSSKLYELFISLLYNSDFNALCKIFARLPKDEKEASIIVDEMLNNINQLEELGVETLNFLESVNGHYDITGNRVFYTDGSVNKDYEYGSRKYYTVKNDANYVLTKSVNRKPDIKLTGLIFNRPLPTIEEINRVKNLSLDCCTSDNDDYAILEVMENNSEIEKENSNGGDMKILAMDHELKETANYFLEVKEEMYRSQRRNV